MSHSFLFEAVSICLILFHPGPTLQAEDNNIVLCLHCVSNSESESDNVTSFLSVQTLSSAKVLSKIEEKRYSVTGPFNKMSERACFSLAKKTKTAYLSICSFRWVACFGQIVSRLTRQLL